jgi:hypothetical protein
MIWQQRPGVAGPPRFGQQPRQPGEEVLAFPVVLEDVPPLDPPDQDVAPLIASLSPGCNPRL